MSHTRTQYIYIYICIHDYMYFMYIYKYTVDSIRTVFAWPMAARGLLDQLGGFERSSRSYGEDVFIFERVPEDVTEHDIYIYIYHVYIYIYHESTGT